MNDRLRWTLRAAAWGWLLGVCIELYCLLGETSADTANSHNTGRAGG